ncbi:MULTISPECIES: hypothetical protein [unclassified Chryseobacterium]|uniref:hypothetical protein n=1 Tax=unclassified Chryseobacterium TaxID=2593645 RepID=UPI002269FD98|nr:MULTISPECIES: hypothetical protein [unclassified Chryseobacterium]
MKKIFIAALLGFAGLAFSQTVNNVPIKDIDVEYVQIVGYERLFSNKIDVDLDFGQNTKFFSGKNDLIILDDKGKVVKFNSMTDALNFMSANGYSLQQVYTVKNTGNDATAVHYILRKNK